MDLSTWIDPSSFWDKLMRAMPSISDKVGEKLLSLRVVRPLFEHIGKLSVKTLDRMLANLRGPWDLSALARARDPEFLDRLLVKVGGLNLPLASQYVAETLSENPKLNEKSVDTIIDMLGDSKSSNLHYVQLLKRRNLSLENVNKLLGRLKSDSQLYRFAVKTTAHNNVNPDVHMMLIDNGHSDYVVENLKNLSGSLYGANENKVFEYLLLKALRPDANDADHTAAYQAIFDPMAVLWSKDAAGTLRKAANPENWPTSSWLVDVIVNRARQLVEKPVQAASLEFLTAKVASLLSSR